jgi:hypothetical protein
MRASLAAFGLVALAEALARAMGSGPSPHQRLFDASLGVYLRWQDPGAVGFVIQAAGSADVTDLSHFAALRNAADAWNDLDGTEVQLSEDATPAQQARTDWQADDLHLILFDENNASGFFPPGSSIVALTPIAYTGTGVIVDADVLFNGAGHQFTTSGESGRFDIQAVAAHEVGHLLGLDHSGWAGATMFPYVDQDRVTQRSLSLDEHNGMREAYPQGSAGELRGSVRRASGQTAVKGAHVVALDPAGRTQGSDLSDGSGQFRIRGLASGTYLLYATPFEGPVSAANVASVGSIQTDFETTLGGTFTLLSGQVLGTGTLQVGADAGVSLGRNFDSLPATCTIGTFSAHSLSGVGLVNGSTLSASDPTLSVTVLAWTGTEVIFGVDVPPGTPPGHADLTVTDPAGNQSTLVAGLELVAPAPGVSAVSPVQGPSSGGTALTVTGTGFLPGLRVVLGGVVYEEGQPGGCALTSPTSIDLTTAPSLNGVSDLVVIDATGVEGRLQAAFQFEATPSVATVFPPAGQASGGTVVTLTGSNFASGAEVRIAGVLQANAVVSGASLLTFTTVPGPVGGPYVLEVRNPDLAAATASFSLAAQPDPSLASLSPSKGSTQGGQNVVLTGTGFTPQTEVWFGADALTGSGGVSAASVNFAGLTSLQAVTPFHSKGLVSVLVRDVQTGQAQVLPSAYAFQKPSSGGGGGGCSVSAIDPPPGGFWAEVAALLPWLLAILFARRLGRVRRAAVSG